MEISISTDNIHVTNHFFIEHSAGVSLVDHLEDTEILFQCADLRRCPFSVLDHPLKECLQLRGLHVLERFLGICESRLKTKATQGTRGKLPD